MERTDDLLRTAVRLLPPPPDSTILVEEFGCLDAGDTAIEGGGEAGGLGGRATGGLHGGAAYECGHAIGGLEGGAAGKGGGMGGGTTTADGAAEEMGGLAGEEPENHANGTQSTGLSISLGRNRRTEEMGYNPKVYRQSFDLYLYGHPLSEFWEELWKLTPLVLHDKELLDASKYIHDEQGVALLKDRGADFTQEITSILSNHPGPVLHFRVDSSVWSGGSDQLGVWMNMISTKGIEEVIIINSALPTDVSFPITTLQSTVLRNLSLGFLCISDLAIGAFQNSSLTELRLFGCTFDGQALSAVISECSSLRELVIGFSVENISIISQSLVSIQMCNSTATSLTVDYAPKLQIISTGVRPRNRGHPVLIDINFSHALKEIYRMLPHHSITIRSACVLKGLVCLYSVRKLMIGVAMSDAHQRSGLVHVLQRLPYLRDLSVWRMDEVGSNEAMDNSFTGVSSLLCVRLCLKYLLMEDFRGGCAEIDVVSRVLGHAPNLLSVSIQPNGMSKEDISVATIELQSSPRASAGCQIIFQSPRKRNL